jgi:hypothetical protein
MNRMLMTENSEEMELETYLKIIDFYNRHLKDDQLVQLWKNRSLIELMKVLKRSKNRDMVKNALVILISLFEKFPPDFYDSLGTNVKCLQKSDKKDYLSALKEEFVI